MKDRVVRAVFAAVVIAVGCGSAWAGTLTWTGEAGDGKWSTPGNWAPCARAPRKSVPLVENVTGEKRLYFNWRYAYGMCISIW